VLLWDCHSIRQYVPTLQKDKFPDLILGDADGAAASSNFTDTVLSVLNQSGYTVSHNHPFKGGYITRYYGKPTKNRHALQLEMTKMNYLDDAEMKYDKVRAAKMQELLKQVFEKLTAQLL
jgi:N-formylglutamate deformylase